MNLIKYYFRKILFFSFEKEIKEALNSFYEIKNKFENDLETSFVFSEISENIEKRIILNPSWFIDSVKNKKKSPKELIYIWLINNSTKSLNITDTFEMSRRYGLEKIINFLTLKLKND